MKDKTAPIRIKKTLRDKVRTVAKSEGRTIQSEFERLVEAGLLTVRKDA